MTIDFAPLLEIVKWLNEEKVILRNMLNTSQYEDSFAKSHRQERVKRLNQIDEQIKEIYSYYWEVITSDYFKHQELPAFTFEKSGAPLTSKYKKTKTE